LLPRRSAEIFRRGEGLASRITLQLSHDVVAHSKQFGSHGSCNVGRQENVREIVERVVRWQDLGFGDVQDRVDPSGNQLFFQGTLVHDLAAGRIDDRAAVAQPGQLGCTNHSDRLCRDRHMDGHYVAAGHQLVQGNELHSEGRGLSFPQVRIVDQDLELERAQELNDFAADAGGPQEADSFLVVSGSGKLQFAVHPATALSIEL
jgi:hypothetical protein